MKVDNVFIAFLKKDEEEHLLFKKDNLYYDLNTKEKYTKDDIDLRTLISFKDSIYCDSDSYFKFFIRFLYNDDRRQLVNIEKLCVADIKQAIDVEKEVINKYRVICEWYPKHIYKTILEECTNGYKDIRDGKKYSGRDRIREGKFYINDSKDSNFKYLKDIFPSEVCIEKGKLLKLQYDVMNNKKIN